MVRDVFPNNLWYLGDKASLPIMVDPKRRYQDLRMEQYWRNRDGQVGHEVDFVREKWGDVNVDDKNSV